MSLTQLDLDDKTASTEFGSMLFTRFVSGTRYAEFHSFLIGRSIWLISVFCQNDKWNSNMTFSKIYFI